MLKAQTVWSFSVNLKLPSPALAVVQHRRPFTAQYRRLKRQRNWLVELERRLDPPEDSHRTRRSVKRQVKDFLA